MRNILRLEDVLLTAEGTSLLCSCLGVCVLSGRSVPTTRLCYPLANALLVVLLPLTESCGARNGRPLSAWFWLS